MNYKDLYQQSMAQSRVFWRKQAELIKLYEFSEIILSREDSLPPKIDDPVIFDAISVIMQERGIGQYGVS